MAVLYAVMGLVAWNEMLNIRKKFTIRKYVAERPYTPGDIVKVNLEFCKYSCDTREFIVIETNVWTSCKALIEILGVQNIWPTRSVEETLEECNRICGDGVPESIHFKRVDE
jgi:hypothetical protein